jgi:probable rRNA maturation factor
VAINFFNEDINFQLPKKRILKSWLSNTIKEHGYRVGDINIVFCSDERIQEINIEYLQHDYATDIITFPYQESNIVSADIFISIPTVKNNAIQFVQSFNEELNRVMVHGVLHLIGFNDSTSKEKKEMREQENICLNKLSPFFYA